MIYHSLTESIKLSGYRLGIIFDKDPLAVEQNNYAIKIVNIYIVCDLDVWAKNSTKDLKFKDCLFYTSNIVKKLNTYSVYGISLNHEGSWNVANDFDENVIIFGVDNKSSSHTENCRNNFLVLSQGQQRKCVINMNFC